MMRRGLVMALSFPSRDRPEDPRIKKIRERLEIGDPDLVLLTKGEIGLLAAIDPRTIDRRIEDGSLPAIKIGSSVRIRLADYLAWLAGGRCAVPLDQNADPASRLVNVPVSGGFVMRDLVEAATAGVSQ